MSQQSNVSPLLKHSFHFDLHHIGQEEEYTLQIGLRDYPLKRHDADSIRRTKSTQLFYGFIPDDNLTHYAEELELEADLVGLMTVTKKVVVDGQMLDLPVSMSVHIPETSFRMMHHASSNLAMNGLIHPKLVQYNVDPNRFSSVNGASHPVQLLVQAFSFKEARETAIALLFQHPGLLHLDGSSEHPAWVHEHLLNQNPYLQDLALAIYKLKENWSAFTKVLDENGEPYKDPDDESKFLYTRTLHPTVKAALNGPLSWALKKAQDAKQLEGQMWEAQYGITSDSYGAEAEHISQAKPKPLQADEDKSASVRWGVKGPKTSWGISVGDPVIDDKGVLNVTGYNRLARHLSAYVEFLNPNGERIDLSEEQWKQVLDSTLRSILPEKFFEQFEPRQETRFVGTVGPVTTVCGVPVGMLMPDPTHFQLPVLDNRIATVRILWGGLGFNIADLMEDPEIRCALVGALLTIIVDIIVPVAIFIIGSSAITNKIVKEIMKDKKLVADIIKIGVLIATGKILYDIAHDRNVINAVAPWIGLVLPRLLITKLGPYLLEKLGESALGKLLGRILPGADMAMSIFSGLTTAAQLLETTIACLSTQSIYKTDFTRTFDLKINLTPDPSTHKFPDLATSYRIAVMYDTNVTTPAVEQKYDLAGPTRSDPFSVKFKDVPAAGKLKIYVFFYAKNGWLAGQGESGGWLEAKGTDGTLLTTNIQIRTNEVRLTSDSVYEHKQKIAYHEGVPVWEATAQAPKQTVKNASADPEKAIDVQNGHITTTQRPAMVGYGWKATGLHLPADRPDAPISDQAMYTVQNLSTLQEPSRSHWHPEVGFSQPSGIVYDVASYEDATGRNFYVDSSNGTYDGYKNARGGFHLRKLVLQHDQKPQTDSKQSWGRFISPLDRFVVHPQGYVIGINYTINKLEILQLPAAPSDDEKATFAVPASGEGFREGLINGPRGIGTALDGRILILESINNRVQSFDIHGNPVKSFGQESKERSWFPLVDPSAKTNYLDLAVEAKGYIYILSYTGEGSDPNDYHLDIYTPDGSFLVRTKGVAASKITVDLIRNVFTLNYETIYAPNGRPEPSVSLWIPPAPSSS
ncbi:hypothetical protein [Paenibacillus sp. MMS18-CY102]|uniref:hypothetical protein n=1 Tax=Paenibacillus sp. MMS18-CY102 TaxID=2682849 RepID=UPI00136601D7|nr:hypothetical protein [Paenibacillus sp. MMS18-CY102]MWC29868.1 hypothetical protein [Paenibacillus sp. MMS18-CY102]